MGEYTNFVQSLVNRSFAGEVDRMLDGCGPCCGYHTLTMKMGYLYLIKAGIRSIVTKSMRNTRPICILYSSDRFLANGVNPHGVMKY